MTTGKIIALTIWTFVGKVMSLLFNTLSRFVIAFLPRSKILLISWLQSPSAVIVEPKKLKSFIISILFPSICYEAWQRHGSEVACCKVGGTECSSACMGSFEGGRPYLHYLHNSVALGQATRREHSPTHQQKIGLKIYRAWPHPSEQDPVSPSVSLSQQEPSISLLSLSIRG